MNRLYLLRHPPVAVAPGICYGRSDMALAEDPARLAERLRAQLPADLAIVSSPSSRCLRLAEALGPCQTDARLMEIDFGEWELARYDDIPRSLIDAWAAAPLHFRPPGGETAAEMATRAIAAANDWMTHAGALPLLIVSHGGPLRAIAGHVRQLAASVWLTLPFRHAELVCLTRAPHETTRPP